MPPTMLEHQIQLSNLSLHYACLAAGAAAFLLILLFLTLLFHHYRMIESDSFYIFSFVLVVGAAVGTPLAILHFSDYFFFSDSLANTITYVHDHKLPYTPIPGDPP